MGVFVGVFSGSFFLGFAMGLVTALVSLKFKTLTTCEAMISKVKHVLYNVGLVLYVLERAPSLNKSKINTTY